MGKVHPRRGGQQAQQEAGGFHHQKEYSRQAEEDRPGRGVEPGLPPGDGRGCLLQAALPDAGEKFVGEVQLQEEQWAAGLLQVPGKPQHIPVEAEQAPLVEGEARNPRPGQQGGKENPFRPQKETPARAQHRQHLRHLVLQVRLARHRSVTRLCMFF